jgi:hypothetical protein
MTRTRTRQQMPAGPRIRCAAYTRKSTDEGLDQEFNTLDAPERVNRFETAAFRN